MLKAGCYSPSRSLLPWFCFLAAVFASAPALRSADGDKWWPDYAGGPASARFFEADQIYEVRRRQTRNRWTYPFGETGFEPDCRPGNRVRARPQRLADREWPRRRARRSGSAKACRR